MKKFKKKNWMIWCSELLSTAQTGLHYSKNDHERERYLHVQRIAISIMAYCSQCELTPQKLNLNSLKGYCTPQVTVRAIMFMKGKLILIHEKSSCSWNLPGGYADINDSPKEAVEREVLEETNLIVRAKKIIAIFQSGKDQLFNQYAIYFLCEITEQKTFEAQNLEIDDMKAVDIDDVDSLRLNQCLRDLWCKLKPLLIDPCDLTEFD